MSETPAIELLAIDLPLADALARGATAFEREYDAVLGERMHHVAEVVAAMLELERSVPRDRPWGGYLAVAAASRQIIGTCGFKAGLSPEGTAELAYFTFPDFEGRGYATAMAGALLTLAAAAPGSREVIAHTLPEENPSTSVLRKIGMRFVGECIDPEDGRVWRWSRAIRASGSPER